MLEAVGNFTSGSVILNRLSPDGFTLLSVSQSITANGGQVLDLAPGQYQLTLSSTSTIWASIERVPLEA